MTQTLPLAVTYEDRLSALPGVEVVARSLAMHAPLMKLRVYSPLPEVENLSQRLTNVEFSYTDTLKGRGWNVKPSTLLWALQDQQRALWLDTDVIVSGDLEGLCQRTPQDCIGVGQEFSGNKSVGGVLRAEQWGFNVGRSIPFHVNSGSILVSKIHSDLLNEWKNCLLDERYLSHQGTAIEHPVAFLGDQDVLWALLVSKQHSHISVRYFEIGQDMLLHCGSRGFQIKDRLRNIKSKNPAFIHMLGQYKPWSFDVMPDKKQNPHAYRHAVCYELSPFHAACEAIAAELGNPNWTKRRTLPARFWHAATFGNVALRGMPLALVSLANELLLRGSQTK